MISIDASRSYPMPEVSERVVLTLFARCVAISHVQWTGGLYCRVTLTGPQLRAVDWKPGDMIRVVVGRAAMRSFTPLYWDTERGVTEFLVYVHGDSPTSRWVKGIETGAVCYVLGPRRRVALNVVAGGSYFFGDESSLALAKSLSTTQGGKNTRYVFEVGSLSEASAVAAGLDLPRAILLERAAGGAHLAEIEEELAYLIRKSHRRFVFSGQAASVERLDQFLRRCGVSLKQRMMAIHWSAGKVGLD